VSDPQLGPREGPKRPGLGPRTDAPSRGSYVGFVASVLSMERRARSCRIESGDGGSNGWSLVGLPIPILNSLSLRRGKGSNRSTENDEPRRKATLFLPIGLGELRKFRASAPRPE
jgi:hypothetical protein